MVKTKIILETGCNHQGDINIAKQMIDDAEKLKVWGIKFQKRDVDSIPEGIKYIPRDMKNSFGINYYEHRKALELSVDEYIKLKKYANKKGLQFIVTVFDIISIDQMINIGVEYLKLPSQLFTSYHMCRYLKNWINIKNMTIMASTGMHDDNEIKEWQYKNIFDIIFYCRSLYPAMACNLNISKMSYLKNILTDIQILGYSSHDKDGIGIPAAVFLGAQYIERHYTLNHLWKGSDHNTVSSTFDEMQQIIKSIEETEILLGNEKAMLCEKELNIRKIYRGF